MHFCGTFGEQFLFWSTRNPRKSDVTRSAIRTGEGNRMVIINCNGGQVATREVVSVRMSSFENFTCNHIRPYIESYQIIPLFVRSCEWQIVNTFVQLCDFVKQNFEAENLRRPTRYNFYDWPELALGHTAAEKGNRVDVQFKINERDSQMAST